jgi:hypothetical protein
MEIDVQQLVAPEDHPFEQAVLLLRRKGHATPRDLAACIDALGKSGFLGSSERQSRTLKLLKLLGAEPLSVLQAWELVTQRTPATKGAVAAYLPASFKPAILASTDHDPIDTGGPDSGRTIFSGESLAATRSSTTEKVAAEGSGAVVILLGDENEFSTSRALLSGSEFASVIRASIDKVDPSDLAVACAIVIGKSRYQHLDTSNQFRLLSSVVRSHGQAWVRFGADGLTPDNLADPVSLTESLGYSKARARSICLAEQSSLTSTDLGFIRSHAKSLDDSLDSSLLVDGLTQQQGALVAFAVRTELSLAGLDHLLKPAINVQMLSGKSGAKVIVARIEGCHHPFVLRLSTKALLLDGEFAELDNIKRLILPWKPVLHPRVYHVGNDAILVYASVTKSQQPDAVATTLADRLLQIQALEPPYPPEGLPNPVELDRAIEEAFEHLSGLNKTVAAGTARDYRYALTDYTRMAEEGRSIRIDSLSEPLEEILAGALAIVNSVTLNAVNHGDPHTRNILLPASSHAELIDFERVHIGHPLYDTCHLALSIAATTYRAYGTFEEIVVDFSKSLFDITADNSRALDSASKVNQTVLQALITARRTAKALSDHYNLPGNSFPAMLTIVASMVLLFLPHLQCQVAKAVIVAATRQIRMAGGSADP